jgi:hypothetical protein
MLPQLQLRQEVGYTRHINPAGTAGTANGSTPSIKNIGDPTKPRRCASSAESITVTVTGTAPRPGSSAADRSASRAGLSFGQSGTTSISITTAPLCRSRTLRVSFPRDGSHSAARCPFDDSAVVHSFRLAHSKHSTGERTVPLICSPTQQHQKSGPLRKGFHLGGVAFDDIPEDLVQLRQKVRREDDAGCRDVVLELLRS